MLNNDQPRSDILRGGLRAVPSDVLKGVLTEIVQAHPQHKRLAATVAMDHDEAETLLALFRADIYLVFSTALDPIYQHPAFIAAEKQRARELYGA